MTSEKSPRGERRSFVVGLRTRRATAMVVLDRRSCPVRGPFTLEAVVSAN